MKTVRLISWLFLAIGGLLLLGALLLWNGARQFVISADTTRGTVVELIEKRDSDGVTYSPVVRFTTAAGEAVTYTESFSGNPAPYDVGESVEVLYVRDQPADARIKGFMSLWFGPMILGILGSLFTLFGGGFVLARRIGRRRKDYLMAYGNAIQTDLQGVERNTTLSVNGRNPWRIASQYRDPVTNQLRVFHSENLWFDPSNFVSAKQVTVLLDPNNPRRYHMDVSFLPDMQGS